MGATSVSRFRISCFDAELPIAVHLGTVLANSWFFSVSELAFYVDLDICDFWISGVCSFRECFWVASRVGGSGGVSFCSVPICRHLCSGGLG